MEKTNFDLVVQYFKDATSQIRGDHRASPYVSAELSLRMGMDYYQPSDVLSWVLDSATFSNVEKENTKYFSKIYESELKFYCKKNKN
jgi:hypothetical protein